MDILGTVSSTMCSLGKTNHSLRCCHMSPVKSLLRLESTHSRRCMLCNADLCLSFSQLTETRNNQKYKCIPGSCISQRPKLANYQLRANPHCNSVLTTGSKVKDRQYTVCRLIHAPAFKHSYDVNLIRTQLSRLLSSFPKYWHIQSSNIFISKWDCQVVRQHLDVRHSLQPPFALGIGFAMQATSG